MAVFGQKLLYSGISGYNRANLIVWAKVIVFDQSFSNREKVVVFGQ